MTDITIVGLGPGVPELRTVAAQRALDTASRIFVRSHDGVDLSDLVARDNVTDIGSLYVRTADLGNRWEAATQAICDAAVDGPVVLAIPGHPRYGEGLVIDTLRQAAERGLSARVLDGISVVDLIATGLGVDPIVAGAQLFNTRQVAAEMASEPFAGGRFTGNPRRPMLFTHVYDDPLRDGMAKALARVFPPDHPIVRIEAIGMEQAQVTEHVIGDLPNVPAGQLVAFWVPPMDLLDAGRDPRTLQQIVARLRAPDGCPWDRKQTSQSLRNALIDEVYEAVDAIDANDMENLAEELGDIFLLIAMHAQIAEESGHFTLEDVFEGISTKIVRRHPHVFGDEAAEHAEAVVGLWQKIKAEERVNGRRGDKAADGQPHSMPGLERAARVLGKHPVDSSSLDSRDPGEHLLATIAGIIDAGDDPDAVLREALERHVAASDRKSS